MGCSTHYEACACREERMRRLEDVALAAECVAATEAGSPRRITAMDGLRMMLGRLHRLDADFSRRTPPPPPAPDRGNPPHREE